MPDDEGEKSLQSGLTGIQDGSSARKYDPVRRQLRVCIGPWGFTDVDEMQEKEGRRGRSLRHPAQRLQRHRR